MAEEVEQFELTNSLGGGNDLPVVIEDGQGGSALKAKVASDGTSNRLFVDSAVTLTGSSAGSYANIFKQAELAVSSRNEVDLAGTTYTVPAGKTFILTSFSGSYDAQAMLYLRLKKQTGGSGPFVTQVRLTCMNGGQGDATTSMNFSDGIIIGAPTDVFKLTVDSSIAKGTLWGAYSGKEV